MDNSALCCMISVSACLLSVCFYLLLWAMFAWIKYDDDDDDDDDDNYVDYLPL